MPLLGFKKQFAPMVEAGTKRQTIRAKRRDGRNPHPGDTLYLYTGLRTKQSRKIGEVICISVEEIVITNAGINLSGVWLNNQQMMSIVRADGFTSWVDFRAFFEKTHHFMAIGDIDGFWGLLIKW
ncbi:MAG: hypothetical protein Q8P24_11000 [Desulfobacterales bacterium]|nr:hypothetical protein [Desulfobacterales bacterium]